MGQSRTVRLIAFLFGSFFLFTGCDDDGGVGTGPEDGGQPGEEERVNISNIRIAEVNEGEQWVEIINTGTEDVNVSTVILCANNNYPEIQTLDVVATDPSGDENLTLAPDERLALQWGQIDASTGDLSIYQSETEDFSNAEQIVDYLRWGSDANEADREDVAVEAGIWTAGSFVAPASEGATIAFLGDDPRNNNEPGDWGDGEPTPAAPNTAL